jgi:inosine-uridine nucleoside N-ribohydrolase
VEDYNLDNYKGTIYKDAIQAMIDVISSCTECTIIGIGPLLNIATLLERRPELAAKCRFVGKMLALSKVIY